VRQEKFRFYEFYENKIREFELKENETKLIFDQYDEVENYKEFYVKNSDSIAFTFNNAGLKILKFNIKHEDLFLSVDGNTLLKMIFSHKYEKHLLDQAKKEFSKEFEAIKNEVNAEMLESKEFIKIKRLKSILKISLWIKEFYRKIPRMKNTYWIVL
jgi:hypothetical protein